MNSRLSVKTSLSCKTPWGYLTPLGVHRWGNAAWTSYPSIKKTFLVVLKTIESLEIHLPCFVKSYKKVRTTHEITWQSTLLVIELQQNNNNINNSNNNNGKTSPSTTAQREEFGNAIKKCWNGELDFTCFHRSFVADKKNEHVEKHCQPRMPETGLKRRCFLVRHIKKTSVNRLAGREDHIKNIWTMNKTSSFWDVQK